MSANREPSNQSFEVDREATVCSASRRFFLRVALEATGSVQLPIEERGSMFALLTEADIERQ
jgi:hypothetical protein